MGYCQVWELVRVWCLQKNALALPLVLKHAELISNSHGLHATSPNLSLISPDRRTFSLGMHPIQVQGLWSAQSSQMRDGLSPNIMIDAPHLLKHCRRVHVVVEPKNLFLEVILMFFCRDWSTYNSKSTEIHASLSTSRHSVIQGVSG